MPEVVYDYAADRPAASESDLQAIARLAKELVLAQAHLDNLTEQAEKAQALVDQLSQIDLPGAMERAGQQSGLVTADGYRIDVKPTVRANVPAATKDRTFDWLDENGHGAIIKRTVEVPFTRDSEEAALRLLDDLQGKFASARVAKKVEPSTMSAWVRAQREAGAELPPPELLTVHDMPVAKVTRK